MERESRLSKREFILQPFLKDAFKEGAHRIKPRKLSKDWWFRQIMIGVVYNDKGSSATVEELADKYRVTRQDISVLNKSFLRNVWNNSSPELKERYPLEEILTVRKPLSQRSREKISARQGGVSLRIKEQVEKGVIDIDKISENIGISKKTIIHTRSTTLKDWGVDIPRKNLSYKEILRQLEEENDDGKIQQLLDKLPLRVISDNINTKKGVSQFLALGNLIREGGFHPDRKNGEYIFFVDSLKKASVPITRKDEVKGNNTYIQTYYILLSKHKDRAMQVLKEDQELQRFLKNPVSLFCGPEDTQLPVTTKLAKKDGYEIVGKIFKELGVRVGLASNIRYSDIFTPDCPVAIFLLGSKHCYPVAQEEELKLFIVKKLNLS